MKAVVIGRHRMLPAQVEELEKLGVEAVEQVLGIDEDRIQETVKKWVENNVKFVIIQALPLRLLHKLYVETSKYGIVLVVAHMKTVGLAANEEEAKRLVSEKPCARTYLKAPGDSAIRVIEHVRWERIKNLEVELEPLREL